MKPILVLVAVWLCGVAGGLVAGERTRPVRDDVGFCWRAAEMDRLVQYLETQAAGRPPSFPVVAGVAPHDDYLYAGRVAWSVLSRIEAPEVVIFGVTHGTVRREIGDPQGVVLLDTFPQWTGPYGPVAVSPLRERLRREMPAAMVRVDDRAHELEHSIESLVPYLQSRHRNLRITPVMVTAMTPARLREVAEAMAGVIAGYVKEGGLLPGRDIAFLVSADANHYGPDFDNVPWGVDEAAHQRAVALERQIAGEVFSGEWGTGRLDVIEARLWPGAGKPVPQWCGRYSIPFGLTVADRVLRSATGRGMRGEVVACSDTWTGGVLPVKGTGLGITAPFSLRHWVGFVAAAFGLSDKVDNSIIK